MGDFEKSGLVHAPAQQLFDFLSDVRNLPRYLARMTSAEPAGEGVHVEAVGPGGRHEAGDAWFRVDDATRRIAWGSEGVTDYRGELEVSGDDAASTVSLRLHTGFEGGDTDADLEGALANIQRLVESGDVPSP